MRQTTRTIQQDGGDAQKDEEIGGEYGLWLRVLVLSVLELRGRRFSASGVKDFIFDPENPFFEFVAGELGFSPEGLRERIREAVKGSEAEIGSGHWKRNTPLLEPCRA
jgi:hypothetical protein